MKVVLFILAVACAAYALPEPLQSRLKREINFEQIKNTCPAKCLTEDKYRQTFSRLAPSGKAMAQKFKAGQKPTDIVPDVDPAQLEECCTEVQKIQTCVSKCNDPADAQVKAKAEAILVALKDLACDPEIKANIACLSKLDEGNPQPPAACEPCKQQLQPLIQNINESHNQGNIDWEKAKVIATAVCKFANCALKCIKEPVTAKCQAAGYKALVTMTKKTANLGQVAHSQFRPPGNFPNECKPDVVVAGAN